MSKIINSKLEYKDYDIFLTLEDKLNNLYKYKIVKDYKTINQLNGVTDYETAIKKAEKYIGKIEKEKLHKEGILKSIDTLKEWIKKDSIKAEYNINNGVFSLPNSNSGIIEHCYDGHMDITFRIYDKEKDDTRELINKIYNDN